MNLSHRPFLCLNRIETEIFLNLKFFREFQQRYHQKIMMMFKNNCRDQV